MKKFTTGLAGVASAIVFTGLGVLMAPAASAVILPPGGLVNAPDYCLAVYGDPDPCPPPDRPSDPTCPPTVHVVYCPYQP